MANPAIQDFEGMDLTSLQEIKTALTSALIAGLVRGQTYSIAGRSFSFANLSDLRITLAACNYAIGLLIGTRSSVVRTNFNAGFNRRQS